VIVVLTHPIVLVPAVAGHDLDDLTLARVWPTWVLSTMIRSPFIGVHGDLPFRGLPSPLVIPRPPPRRNRLRLGALFAHERQRGGPSPGDWITNAWGQGRHLIGTRHAQNGQSVRGDNLNGQSVAMAKVQEIVFDCQRTPLLARFWAAALGGYEVRPYDDAEIRRLATLGLTPETDRTVMIDGPGASMCFQQVTETKEGKNRVHLDLPSLDHRREVERLVLLGASIHAGYKDHTVVLDPEGNQFCVWERR
jgi:Glyoxalase-like domain